MKMFPFSTAFLPVRGLASFKASRVLLAQALDTESPLPLPLRPRKSVAIPGHVEEPLRFYAGASPQNARRFSVSADEPWGGGDTGCILCLQRAALPRALLALLPCAQRLGVADARWRCRTLNGLPNRRLSPTNGTSLARRAAAKIFADRVRFVPVQPYLLGANGGKLVLSTR